jgi:Zn-dependent alcohol dehydrogenase
MIGMGVLIGAVARGAEVIAVDMSAGKLALARSFGASHVIDASAQGRRRRHSGPYRG